MPPTDSWHRVHSDRCKFQHFKNYPSVNHCFTAGKKTWFGTVTPRGDNGSRQYSYEMINSLCDLLTSATPIINLLELIWSICSRWLQDSKNQGYCLLKIPCSPKNPRTVRIAVLDSPFRTRTAALKSPFSGKVDGQSRNCTIQFFKQLMRWFGLPNRMEASIIVEFVNLNSYSNLRFWKQHRVGNWQSITGPQNHPSSHQQSMMHLTRQCILSPQSTSLCYS
jgi:hypothetical protein